MHRWYHTIDNLSLQDLLLQTFYLMLFHIRIRHFCHGFNINISRNLSEKFVYVSVMLTTSYMSVALLSITNRSINHFNNTQVYTVVQILRGFYGSLPSGICIPLSPLFLKKKKNSNLAKCPLLLSRVIRKTVQRHMTHDDTQSSLYRSE